MNKEKFAGKTAKRIFAYYKPFWPQLALLMFLMFCGVASGMLPAWFFGQIINLINDQAELSQIMTVVFIMFGIKLFRAVLENVRVALEYKLLDFKILEHVNKLSMDIIRKLSIGQLYGQDSQKISTIIGKGERSVKSLMYNFLYALFPMLVMIVSSAVALLIIDWIIGLVVLVSLVLYLLIAKFVTIRFKKRLDFVQKIGNNLESRLREILSHLFVIKAYAKEKSVSKNHAGRLGRFSRYQENLNARWAIADMSRDIIPVLSELVVLYLACSFVASGKSQPGDLVVVWAWSSRVMMNLQPLNRIHKTIMESLAAVRRYFILVDIEPTVKDVLGGPKVSRVEGYIKFDNVSFSYPASVMTELLDEEKPNKKNGSKKEDVSSIHAVKDVSFEISPGETVAIVGRSGSGKTTLAALLLRGYDPDGGSIFIDGVNLNQLDLVSYRSCISIVEQETSLFYGSLRDNILFGLPENTNHDDVTDDVVMNMCEHSRITQFWDRLEEGLQTKIGENGVLLSGGQRQRVGIARALIKKPDLLVLDEATSHLDSQTENDIRMAIEDTSSDRTTVIIAHRLSTVRDADKIIVLEKGKVVGIGSHTVLSENCEEYRDLISKQSA